MEFSIEMLTLIHDTANNQIVSYFILEVAYSSTKYIACLEAEGY